MRIRIIYLAAGNGRRFCRSLEDCMNEPEAEQGKRELLQQNKLLYELGGKPMYRHLLDRLKRIVSRHSDWELVVVSQYKDITDALPEMSVYCEESVKGVSYSIKAGVLAETGNCESPEAYAFFVADQPYFTESSAEAFLEYMEKAKAELGQVICGERVGNPTWFAKEYRDDLLALSGDRGGRVILKRNLHQVTGFAIKDENELKDIDMISELNVV